MQIIRDRFSCTALFSCIFLSLSLAVVAKSSSLLGPQISGNTAGQVVAIWTEFNGNYFVIKQAERPFGGSWESFVQLSPDGQNCMYPDVDINASGTILSVWKNKDVGVPSMQVCFDAFGSDADPLLATTSFYAGPPLVGYFPDVEIANSGRGIALWQGSGASGYMLLATGCSEGDLRTPVVYLSSPTSFLPDPDFVVDTDSGTGLAVWVSATGTGREVVVGSVSLSGDRQGPVSLSTTGTNASSPVVVFNSTGQAFAAWVTKTQPYSGLEVTALSDTLAGNPTTLSMSGTNLTTPCIAANAADQVLLVAEARVSDTSQVVAAFREGTGSWGAFETLCATASTQVKTPVVALNDAGEGMAVWVDKTSGKGVVQVAQYSSGTWSAPVSLSSTQYSSSVPVLYLHDTGYAVVAWLSLGNQQSSETNSILIQAVCLPSMTGTWGPVQTLFPSP